MEHTKRSKKDTITVGVAMAVLALIGVTLASLTLTGCKDKISPEKRLALADKMVSAHMDWILDEIKATPSQRQAFKETKSWAFATFRKLAPKKQAMHKQALAELQSNSPSSARLHNLLDEALKQKQQLAHEGLDKLLELHARLSPQQRQVLFELVHEKMGRHGGHLHGSW